MVVVVVVVVRWKNAFMTFPRTICTKGKLKQSSYWVWTGVYESIYSDDNRYATNAPTIDTVSAFFSINSEYEAETQTVLVLGLNWDLRVYLLRR